MKESKSSHTSPITEPDFDSALYPSSQAPQMALSTSRSIYDSAPSASPVNHRHQAHPPANRPHHHSARRSSGEHSLSAAPS